MNIPIVIYTQKDFFLLDALNEKLGTLKASGLINFWHKQQVPEDISSSNEFKLPKVLNLHHLMGSFQILIFGLVSSIFAFISELLLKLYTRVHA